MVDRLDLPSRSILPAHSQRIQFQVHHQSFCLLVESLLRRIGKLAVPRGHRPCTSHQALNIQTESNHTLSKASSQRVKWPRERLQCLLHLTVLGSMFMEASTPPAIRFRNPTNPAIHNHNTTNCSPGISSKLYFTTKASGPCRYQQFRRREALTGIQPFRVPSNLHIP